MAMLQAKAGSKFALDGLASRRVDLCASEPAMMLKTAMSFIWTASSNAAEFLVTRRTAGYNRY